MGMGRKAKPNPLTHPEGLCIDEIDALIDAQWDKAACEIRNSAES